jgi:hypothetical protein
VAAIGLIIADVRQHVVDVVESETVLFHIPGPPSCAVRVPARRPTA